MFPKETLDLIILSILGDNLEGLTGYSIMKQMKLSLGPFGTQSPGTIYPRLKKMVESGDISENDKIYTISEQGKQRLTDFVPDALNFGIDFFPKFFNTLMKTLPTKIKFDLYSDSYPFFGCSSCSPFTETEDFTDDLNCSRISDSLENLESMKKRLQKTKEKIIIRMNKQIEDIDRKITQIDSKIKNCKDEKKLWKKIPIEDGDFNEE